MASDGGSFLPHIIWWMLWLPEWKVLFLWKILITSISFKYFRAFISITMVFWSIIQPKQSRDPEIFFLFLFYPATFFKQLSPKMITLRTVGSQIWITNGLLNITVCMQYWFTYIIVACCFSTICFGMKRLRELVPHVHRYLPVCIGLQWYFQIIDGERIKIPINQNCIPRWIETSTIRSWLIWYHSHNIHTWQDRQIK